MSLSRRDKGAGVGLLWKMNAHVLLPLYCADPLDYIGGTVDVTFGTNAGDRQCINIMLVSDNERESREDFFVDVDLDDMGRIRAGNPPRTVVGIEGICYAYNMAACGGVDKGQGWGEQ